MTRNRAIRALTRGVIGAGLGIIAAGTLQTTAPAADPSAKISAVLPADVAARVLARIAEAGAGAPAAALENRVLKFAARGVVPREIERSVNEHAARLGAAKNAIETARGKEAGDDEVEAGAEALRQGVDGAAVSELAKEAPSGRSSRYRSTSSAGWWIAGCRPTTRWPGCWSDSPRGQAMRRFNGSPASCSSGGGRPGE